jgi:hypothetical protein
MLGFCVVGLPSGTGYTNYSKQFHPARSLASDTKPAHMAAIVSV